MTFGERIYGEVPYGEAGTAVVSTVVALATSVAVGFAPDVVGDTYTASPGFASAVAHGYNPAVSQEATVYPGLARAKAVGLTPILSGVTLVIPLARSKAVGLSPAWTQVISGGTDSSNANDGRSRGGLSTGTTTRPVAPTPPGLSVGERVDKVMAYPTPTMVGGRPT